METIVVHHKTIVVEIPHPLAKQSNSYFKYGIQTKQVKKNKERKSKN